MLGFRFGRKRKKTAAKARPLDTVPGSRRAWQLPTRALIITLIVEILNRRNAQKLLTFLVERPQYFAYGWLIVLTTLMFSELFKRRRAALNVLTVAWIAFGVSNVCVIGSRTQPFAIMDLFMIPEAIKLTTLYYTIPQIILMYGAMFIALVLVIFYVTRLPKRRKVKYAPALISCTGLTLLCVCLCTVGISNGTFPRRSEDLIDEYDRYGFVTAFTFTFGNMGVSRPSDYSQDTVTGIIDEIATTASPEPAATPAPEGNALPVFTEADDLAHPNIIFVQLESFFDVNTIIGAEYSKDPTPNFTRLCKDFPSGTLYMPSVGGGTANSEFEVLTGFALDFFATGEYPYSTVLQEKTCDSVAFRLRDIGYATTAMHNNTATFYDRVGVYPRIGFERFVSLEYMPYVSYTEVGWAQDRILDAEIVKALSSTDQRDFIMAITVESHGKYPSEYLPHEGDAEPIRFPEQINEGELRNYLHVIGEVDDFIGLLTNMLTYYKEPTVVVFYGDHLPALNLSGDILTTGSVYASRYVIWNNFGAQPTAPDCEAYRMSASLMTQLGLPVGVIGRFHQSYPIDCRDEEYMTKLETLEYDLLYGDQTGYENGAPVAPELTMGSVPITLTGVSHRYGRVLVTGQNFTEFSTIYLDDVAYPTAFVSSSQLICVVPDDLRINTVAVAQVASDATELSRTDSRYIGEHPEDA